jgi:hypothetical protein
MKAHAGLTFAAKVSPASRRYHRYILTLKTIRGDTPQIKDIDSPDKSKTAT